MANLSPRCKRWINNCFEYLEESGYGLIQKEDQLKLVLLADVPQSNLIKPWQLTTSTQLSQLMECMKQIIVM